MKIAVIVLNYNSSEECVKVIPFLKKQTGVEIEIIVVDNCSNEKDRQIVENLSKDFFCTFIANKENRGYNAGNNIGLRYAAEKGYKYALIANPDMEFPQQNYIQVLAENMESDSSIAVSGSDIITPEGVHQNPKILPKDNWLHSFNWVKDAFTRNKTGSTPNWIENPCKSHFCKAVNGCCFMIRLDFLKEIGFFDERTFLYGEETILGKQVELSGYKMHYDANIQAIHNHRKSKEKSSAFRLKHWRNSRLHYINQYGNYPSYGKWAATASIFTHYLVFLAYHGISGVDKKNKKS